MGDALSALASGTKGAGAQGPQVHGTIRSLIKGLRLLETLNANPAISFREVCEKAALSEGTAFRMLRTLLDLGLIKHDPRSRTYSVARRVMTLSHGYDAEGWVSAVAWPRLRQLGDEIDWPVSLLMLSGPHVLVRATTDQYSQMVFGVSRAGVQMPILGSCSGVTLLAHLPPVEQDARLALLEATAQRALLATRSREEWQALFSRIRHDGWWGRVQTETRQSFVSIPVKMNDEAMLGVITMKYFTSAMKLEEATIRYGNAMRAAAQDINAGYQAWICDMDQETESHHV
jgi:DNA-binding IclR family transcriptional regulator